MREEEGVTLIEVLVTVSLAAILLTLSANALRTYWRNQQIDGAGEQVVSQLRQVQEQTDSESHPLVYGVRFDVGTSNWAIVRYDPKSSATTTDDECTVSGTRSFPAGVTISAASFTAPSGILISKCSSSSQPFAFFYARGTATAGSATLSQASTGKTRTISVLPLTGRVRQS